MLQADVKLQYCRRSTDYDKEVVYQVDVVPTGSFLAREEPAKKGGIYVLTT